MTLIETPDNQFPTHSPSDVRNRLRFPLSKPTLWLKTPSMESFSSTRKTRIPNNSLKSVSPALKKRHSTLELSPPSDLPPTPIPPQRPLRNPARRDTGVPNIPAKPKAKKRPSTATGAPEQVIPWVVSPPTGNTSTTTIPGTIVSSSVSTRSRSSLAGTGPVEEVTPWELYPVQSTTTRRTLSTGPTEEVTPWELYPISAPKRNRSPLSTSLVEDVTPWDLFPVPIPEEPGKSNEKQSRSSARPSTSPGQGKSLSDLAQIRRLKHTNGKALKTRSNTIPTGVAPSSDRERAGNFKGAGSSTSVPNSPKLSHKTPSATSSDASRPSTTSQNPQFSTADRTILEELKRNISVRAAQFTVKGAGIVDGCGIVHPGKKHHPYGREEVPYPRSYDRQVLDLDVWETVFCQNLCESLTWHVFQTPPAKVLDLGCGTGTWLLNSARSWRDSQFVGLDIVPLHPDLQQVGSPDLASRITWVQTNFLEGLPFPNEEFDFVHVKRIALGVPEDKWDFLLEEISRVMKPGGAFEMLEEDLFFPGKSLDGDSDSNSDDDFVSSQPSSPRDSGVSENRHERDESDATVTRSRHSHDSADDLMTTGTTSTSPVTPSRSGCPSIDVVINEEGGRDQARDLISQAYVDYPELAQPQKIESTKFIFPPPRSPDRPQPQPKSASRGHLPYQSMLAASAASLLLSSVASVPPPDELLGNTINVRPPTRRRGYSLTASTPSPAPAVARRLQNKSQVVINEPSKTPPAPPQKLTSFLVRTVPTPPVNPRDHSLLESIYTRMLGSRFINMSPLALLTNSLGVYFKDVRTHPPLQHAFPPRPTKPPSHIDVAYCSDTDSGSDSDDARNAILPKSRPRSIKTQRTYFSARSSGSEESKPISEDNRFLDIQSLLQRGSQYITLDDTRIYAFSPTSKATFPSATSTQTNKARRGSRLPNTTMNFDLKSLNLHLALRAAEILACSESMWEWVLEYQGKAAARKASSSVIRRVKSGSVDLPSQKSLSSFSSSRNSSESVRNSILELTRDDFNGLLSNFDMDMRDKYSIGSALEDRFSWSIIPSAPSPERKIFETACEKWDKWEYEQLNAPSRPSQPNRLRPARPATADTSYSAPQPSLGATSYNREHDIMKLKKRLSMSSHSTLLPPTRRMSRTTRVFVAWKA